MPLTIPDYQKKGIILAFWIGFFISTTLFFSLFGKDSAVAWIKYDVLSRILVAALFGTAIGSASGILCWLILNLNIAIDKTK